MSVAKSRLGFRSDRPRGFVAGCVSNPEHPILGEHAGIGEGALFPLARLLRRCDEVNCLTNVARHQGETRTLQKIGHPYLPVSLLIHPLSRLSPARTSLVCPAGQHIGVREVYP